jgi:heterodisulfide reductase subunit B2
MSRMDQSKTVLPGHQVTGSPGHVYTYYPGCTLYTKARNLDRGARLAAEKLDIKLVEMKSWTCCGAIYNTNSDDLAALVGPVRNLCRASQSGDRLVTLCSACYNVLKRANQSLSDPAQVSNSRRLIEYIDEEYRPGLKVVHLLEVLRDDVGWDKVKDKVRKALRGMKVASYYGCLMTRPHKVMDMGHATDPTLLDDLMRVLGADPVDFDFKTKCCGGYLVVSQRDAAVNCSRRIIDNARLMGAEIMTTSCPLCHYNIDALQKDMAAKDRNFKPMPVLYFTKLLGLALGLKEPQLALDYARVDPKPLLGKYGLLD